MHALCPSLWGQWSHHFPASQLQNAPVLCSSSEETQGQGPGASCSLKGWAGLPAVAPRSSAHQHSEWRSEAGGLGQGKEGEESWRLEATNQALRELAWQGCGPGHPKGSSGL